LEVNRLGMLWLVIRPILDAAIYGTIFGVVMGGRRGEDYISYVVIGVFLFELFSKSFSNGSKSITGNKALVQSLAFPRITMPLSKVYEEFLTCLPAVFLLLVILPITGGHWPTWEWLYLVPLLALYLLFCAGVAFFVARLTVHIRDLSQLLPFISRIMFYASGVLFQVDIIFQGHAWVQRIFDWYPLYQVLTLARSFLRGQPMNGWYWVSLAGWAVVMFVGGLLFFWVAEERYGRD
jgi:teichoic acid transport system permease protein